jgi:hypothetical protein
MGNTNFASITAGDNHTELTWKVKFQKMVPAVLESL